MAQGLRTTRDASLMGDVIYTTKLDHRQDLEA